MSDGKDIGPVDYPTFEITENDDGIRPAGALDQCFYCGQPVGTKHIVGCVITWRYKTVDLEAHVSFKAEVPEHWSSMDIYRRYNLGSWCASNLANEFTETDCGCGRTHVTVVSPVDA